MSLRAVLWRSNLPVNEEILSITVFRLNGDCLGASLLATTFTLLIKCLLDNIFDGRVSDGDVVNGQVSQKSGRDAGDILCFDLDILFLCVFVILNKSAIFGQIMRV